MTKIEQRERKRCIGIPRTVLIFSDIVRIAINMLQYSTTNVDKIEMAQYLQFLHIENTANGVFNSFNFLRLV